MNDNTPKPKSVALWRWPIVFVLGFIWIVVRVLSFPAGGVGKVLRAADLWLLERIEELLE